jgi:biopolymer transport protein ExbB
MKMRGLLMAMLLFGGYPPVDAQPEPVASLDDLLGQVREMRALEIRKTVEREQRFLAERDAQKRRLEEMEAALATEQRRNDTLQRTFDENEKTLVELQQRLRERSGSLIDLASIFHQVAGDTLANFENSLISTQLHERVEVLETLAAKRGLPSIAAMEDLWFALQQEMTESGRVVSYTTRVIATDGTEQEQVVTRVGSFNAVANGRFLRYLPETAQLQELSRQPARHYRRMAGDMERATTALTPMAVDPSRGAVLALLIQTPDMVERVRQGRLVGYVIIALAILGVLLAVERVVHLSIIGRRIKNQLASDIPSPGNPLGRVMAVYHENRRVDTETLELKLDEAVLRDAPGLQRGLGTIRILAVIAPMLGLLGTVTGLIETFQAITLFGTGDARLMAGGISQALVTTVLGLSAAIPLILLHTAVNGKSRQLLSVLQEQSAGIIASHAEKERQHVVCA